MADAPADVIRYRIYVPCTCAAPHNNEDVFIVAFTPQQTQAARCVAKGYTNDEIADAMGVSTSRVKAYIGGLLRRTGTRHRTELVLFLLRRGLIELEKEPSHDRTTD